MAVHASRNRMLYRFIFLLGRGGSSPMFLRRAAHSAWSAVVPWIMVLSTSQSTSFTSLGVDDEGATSVPLLLSIASDRSLFQTVLPETEGPAASFHFPIL